MQQFFGNCTVEWSARWKGDNADSYVDITWNSESGWNVIGYWYGTLIFMLQGYRSLPLAKLFQQPPKDIPLEKNPTNLPIQHISESKQLPTLFVTPGGWLHTIAVPLHVKEVTHAVSRFLTLSKDRLYSSVNASVLLSRSQIEQKVNENVSVSEIWNESKREGFKPSLVKNY